MFEAPADGTAQLTDWVCLGTFEPGAQVMLEVTLEVPIELDNQFQETAGYLDWQFKVEEFPVQEDVPKPTDPPGPSEESGSTPTVPGGIPATGDDSQACLFLTLAVVSCLLLGILLRLKYRTRTAF